VVEEDFDPSNVAKKSRKPLGTSIVKLEVAPRKLFGKPVQTLKVNQLQELKRNRKACKCTSKPRRSERTASKTTFACPCGISAAMWFLADCQVFKAAENKEAKASWTS
jgi:hypothetical protein